MRDTRRVAGVLLPAERARHAVPLREPATWHLARSLPERCRILPARANRRKPFRGTRRDPRATCAAPEPRGPRFAPLATSLLRHKKRRQFRRVFARVRPRRGLGQLRLGTIPSASALPAPRRVPPRVSQILRGTPLLPAAPAARHPTNRGLRRHSTDPSFARPATVAAPVAQAFLPARCWNRPGLHRVQPGLAVLLVPDRTSLAQFRESARRSAQTIRLETPDQ